MVVATVHQAECRCCQPETDKSSRPVAIHEGEVGRLSLHPPAAAGPAAPGRAADPVAAGSTRAVERALALLAEAARLAG